MASVALLALLLGGFGLVLAWANNRYRPDTPTLIDAIDALLPQTQCAQCGYPGCRPYAEALAAGAATNLCPPGGADTFAALRRLLGHDQGDVSQPPTAPTPVRAVIDEQKCIGCYLCVQVCPVDAIVGSPQLMHTVLAGACTGCELCLPPCPVDCIELVEVPPEPTLPPENRRRWPDRPATECIRCGVCEDICPVDLQPQELLWYSGNNSATHLTQHPARASQLERCIECALCNQVCPSNIDLAGYFQRDRHQLTELARSDHAAAAARQRFANHRSRIDARSSARTSRRSDRIAARAQRPWTS
jgi:electron transport complex protein RnfB